VYLKIKSGKNLRQMDRWEKHRFPGEERLSMLANPWREKSRISPQREQGNRQISNEVFLALIRASLTGVEYQMVMLIIHLSWGFNHLTAVIPCSEFAVHTDLPKRSVKRALTNLQNRHIVYCAPSRIKKKGTAVNEYGFNKHYDTWDTDKPVDNSRKLSTEGVTRMSRVTRIAQKGCPKCHPYINKERERKDIKSLINKDKKNTLNKSKKNGNSKNTDYKNNNFQKTLEKKFGRMATTKMVQKFLVETDPKLWHRVKGFLSYRWAKDGARIYQEAVMEIKADMSSDRTGKNKLSALTAGIGN
jgi:phage replication O-like protein O